ncbi:MAG: hypothetical protein WDA16_04305 [Candidatus Thermoplasmatota archaeon]
MLSGCITNTAGPTTVDVYNAGSQIVKVHVLFNTSIGHLIEEQVFIVGPANVDEKNVKATNATGRLLLDAFTESGLHLAAPISVTMSGATVNVNVTDTTLSAAATGK